MAKRGKYRAYNKGFEGFKKVNKGDADVSTKFTNEHERKIAGSAMYYRVAAERYRHYIGEKRTINRLIQSNERERTIGGVVIGIYPHFLLLDCGNYNTTITYTDLVLGGKRYAYD